MAAFVKSASSSSATDSASVAFATDVTSGALIVIYGSQDESAVNDFIVGDCTKSAGTATIDTIQLDVTRKQFEDTGPFEVRCAQWSCLVTGSGSLTLQVNNPDVANVFATNIHVAEFSGSWDGSRVDGTNNNGSSTDNVSPAVTGTVLSTAGAVFSGNATYWESSLGAVAEEAAFTEIEETTDTSVGDFLQHSAYRIVTVATTDEAEWTCTDHDVYAACLVVYQESGIGGGVSDVNFSGSNRGIARGVLRGVG